MADASHRFVVITGGPGSGKTTLIEMLAASGHAVMPEAGRAVIREQMAAGGNGLPWADRARFAELMLAHDLRSHAAAKDQPGFVFFDRGIPDIAGYLGLCGLPVPETIGRAAEACRYRETVFIAPFWPEIFKQDAERRQDPAEAKRTYEAMVATYPRYGYRLLELPRASVADRAAFVMRHLAAEA
ncbi:AAA family ATPase [Bosea sp. SSUT16]|uniref:AAA family ATPase n=1 Tax=Bosea spartocytisi TaxID=2773451 RepID=A0A927EFN5_9HYPH|nr:AAA family ATPase [Bosea spartocytisi]MBD3848194.1 AAA family ATPase [Bosea spartocytisi]MCT4471770.1 AAA family ATPase [Bosea spartocytisi]